MSVIDILFRVDDICRKYDKYDLDKQKDNAHGDDAFARLYSAFEADIDKAFIKYEAATHEPNRAVAVAMNAEVRRTKARLMEELPKLAKLSQRKVKGLSQEEQQTRSDMVLALSERIESIPDSITSKPTGGVATSSSPNHIKFESADTNFGSEFCQESEESSQFRQEFEIRKMKQDQGLDVISDGLDTLKSLAQDMNEELEKQVPLIDEIETKVDLATNDLKTNNKRLKETLLKVRSSRNMCIDIVLMCVLLGIIYALYKALT